MKNANRKIELLSPAGDFERLKIAYQYGADAVYVGGKLFSLRANAINFSLEELKQATNYAHSLNKKIYVTVNILLHNRELEKIKDYLIKLDEMRIDAIIISDLSIIPIAQKHTSLELHLSTQMSTLNKESAQYLKELGITRIVLGRESSKEDIQDIIDNVNVEIEVFIHGAMCASYSGRCVMSNYLTKRDANRGGCSQICRWDFDLFENNKKIEADKKFTFSSKDLSMLNNIKSMINKNITSLKVEGRMRSIYYIAVVIGIYRNIIDKTYNKTITKKYLDEAKKTLDLVANRESIEQFYNCNNEKEYQYYNGRVEISNQDFLGIIKNYDKKTKMVTIEQRNYFKKGDTVEIFGPFIEPFTITLNEIYDEEHNLLNIVRHPLQIVKIPLNKEVKKDYLMRVKHKDQFKNDH